MDNIADPLEVRIVERIALQVPLVVPASLDWALFSTPPADDGTGGVELTTGTAPGYARKSLNLSTGIWTRTGSVITNTGAIVWPTATGNWPSVTGWAAYNGSEIWLRGSFDAPYAQVSGGAFTIGAGALAFAFGGNLTNERRGVLAEWLFRAGAVVWPSTLGVALASTTPTAAAPGTEITGNAYARLAIPCTNDYWVRVGNRIANGVNFTWGQATPAAWPDVLGADIYDDDTGTRWFFKGIPAKPVPALSQARILADSGDGTVVGLALTAS